MRLFIVSYTKGGREITRAFKRRIDAVEEAKLVSRDEEVASAAVHEYVSPGSAEEALIAVMSAATNAKQAWADERKLALVVTKPTTKVTRS